MGVLVAGCLVLALSGCGHGDPDPGGRILTALRSIESAVPTGATDVRTQDAEPLWDSCDGRPGTEGWSVISVDIEFRDDRDGRVLLDDVADRMTEAGWAPGGTGTSPLGPSESWTRTLDDGTVAHGSLSPGTRDDGVSIIWFLTATAPPHGRQASGC